jgi:hypothetical protein
LHAAFDNRSTPKVQNKNDAPGATGTLLTNLLDLLADKGILSNQDLTALAEAAQAEMSAQPSKRDSSRLNALREKVKSRKQEFRFSRERH